METDLIELKRRLKKLILYPAFEFARESNRP